MVSRQFITFLRRSGVAGVVLAASMAAGAPASAAPAPPSADVTCSYEVAADWLRHRTTPQLRRDNALGQYRKGTKVLAERDVVINGFRALSNGEWASAAHLDRTEAPCFS
jgi:hypothetical protein